MAGLIDTDSGLEFGTGLVWLAGGIGQAGLVITSSTSGAALFLAEWGPYGMDMDFTDASIAIDDSTGVLDYNSQGTVSSTTGALLGPGSKLTYSAPSLKFTEQADGYIAGQAHNIALYSEDFTNAAWVVANCTKSGTAEVTITLSAGTAGKYLGQTIAVVSGALSSGEPVPLVQVHIAEVPHEGTRSLWNFWYHSASAEALIKDPPPDGWPPEADLFERTHLLEMIDARTGIAMEWAAFLGTDGEPPGYETPSGVRLYDPSLIASPNLVKQ